MAETERAIFAGGCFWCTEAVFKPLKGVKSVVSGYIGGETENPSYHEVCSGTTGHAEAVEIVFDPEVVGYDVLLDVFFATHDPTQLNRQGNDVGTQYRSGVFTLSEEQAAAARAAIERAGEMWPGDIVTEVTPAGVFHPGEDYHQDYFANNWRKPYCWAVILPKVAKVRLKYARLLA